MAHFANRSTEANAADRFRKRIEKMIENAMLQSRTEENFLSEQNKNAGLQVRSFSSNPINAFAIFGYGNSTTVGP